MSEEEVKELCKKLDEQVKQCENHMGKKIKSIQMERTGREGTPIFRGWTFTLEENK